MGIIGVVADDVYATSTLEKIKRLTAAVEKVDGVDHVESLTNVPDYLADLTNPPLLIATTAMGPATLAALKRKIADTPIYLNMKICGSVEDDQLMDVLQAEIISARAIGQSVGIFAHGNDPVADLSAELFAIGVDHVLVVLPEAHGEALATLEALCLFGGWAASFRRCATPSSSFPGRLSPEK